MRAIVPCCAPAEMFLVSEPMKLFGRNENDSIAKSGLQTLPQAYHLPAVLSCATRVGMVDSVMSYASIASPHIFLSSSMMSCDVWAPSAFCSSSAGSHESAERRPSQSASLMPALGHLRAANVQMTGSLFLRSMHALPSLMMKEK